MSLQAVPTATHAAHASARIAQATQNNSPATASAKPQTSNTNGGNGASASAAPSDHRTNGNATEARLRGELSSNTSSVSTRSNSHDTGASNHGKTVVSDTRVAAAPNTMSAEDKRNFAAAMKSNTTEVKSNPSNWRSYNDLKQQLRYANDYPDSVDSNTRQQAQAVLTSSLDKAQGAWQQEFDTKMARAELSVQIATSQGASKKDFEIAKAATSEAGDIRFQAPNDREFEAMDRVASLDNYLSRNSPATSDYRPTHESRFAPRPEKAPWERRDMSAEITGLTSELKANPSNWKAYHALDREIGYAQNAHNYHDLDAVKGAQQVMASAKNAAWAGWTNDYNAAVAEADKAVNNATRSPGWFGFGGPSEQDGIRAHEAVHAARNMTTAAPDIDLPKGTSDKIEALDRQLSDHGIRDPYMTGGSE